MYRMFSQYRINKILIIITLCSAFVTVTNSNGPVNDRKQMLTNRKYVLMCYYGIYYRKRMELQQQEPEKIQPFLCTHIIFNYAKIDRLEIIPGSAGDDNYKGYTESGMYARINDLKNYNSDLKTLLSIGGRTPRREFVKAVSSEDSRHTFSLNAIKYLRKWNFDGLTLDWEYPNEPVKTQFTLWCKKIMEVFTAEALKTGKPRLLLTVAVQKGNYAEQFYEMEKLAEHVDFLHLITFDYVWTWPPHTMPDTSVKIAAKAPIKELEQSIDVWLAKNVPKDKLVVGLSTFARTFTIPDKNKHSMGDDLVSHGNGGPYSKQLGYLFYGEVCDLLIKEHYNEDWDEKSQTPYAYLGDQWLTFDNARSFKAKADLIKRKGIAGASIYEITQDDFSKSCGDQLYPLTGQIHVEFFGKPYSRQELTTFVFITSTTTAKIEPKKMSEIATGKTRKTPEVNRNEMTQIVTGKTATTAFIASRSTITFSSSVTVVFMFQIICLLQIY